MSIMFERELKEFQDSKEDIAKAISLGVGNGSEKYYNYFREKFLNNTKAFFVEVKDFSSSYMKDVNSLLAQLNDMLGHDVSNYIFNRQNVRVAYASNVEEANLKKEKPDEIYDKYKGIYDNVGVTRNDIKTLYNQGGKDKVDELNSLIKEVKKKTFMGEFKEKISMFKETMQSFSMNKKLDKVTKKYNVNSFEDLLSLNTEMSMFLVDESKLNDAQKRMVESNKNKFKKRMGVDENYTFSKQHILKMKKEIEPICNFNMYEQAFNHTNIGDLFKVYGYEFNGKNMKNAFNLLFSIFSATGVCINCDFGEGEKKYCVMGSQMFSMSSDYINSIVVHECIHSLETLSKDEINFCFKYRSLNEAMTQYLTEKSKPYLSKNIFPSKGNNPHTEYRCVYDNMLPLVEELSKSELWDDLIKVKFHDHVKEFENKVGLDTIVKIAKCFDKANIWDNRDTTIQKECLEELKTILSKKRVM